MFDPEITWTVASTRAWFAHCLLAGCAQCGQCSQGWSLCNAPGPSWLATGVSEEWTLPTPVFQCQPQQRHRCRLSLSCETSVDRWQWKSSVNRRLLNCNPCNLSWSKRKRACTLINLSFPLITTRFILKKIRANFARFFGFKHCFSNSLVNHCSVQFFSIFLYIMNCLILFPK